MYVKFRRGLKSRWDTMVNKDADTLYFIYENANATEGWLYLGSKLISGPASENGGVSRLSELEDMLLTNNLSNRQIIAYNEMTSRWENVSIGDIISNNDIGVMKGATSTTPGEKGLVPAPAISDINKFLKGDGTWSEVPSVVLDDRIFINNVGISTLQGFEDATIGSHVVKSSSGIEWQPVINSSLKLDIKTLDQINQMISNPIDNGDPSNTIFLVQKEVSSTSNFYDEYVVINGNLERVGEFADVIPDLSDYVRQEDFTPVQNTVENLDHLINGYIDENDVEHPGIDFSSFITQAQIGGLSNLILSEGNNTLVEEINYINERLTWNDLE